METNEEDSKTTTPNKDGFEPLDWPIKKKPDEEEPSLLGNEKNLLNIPPSKNKEGSFKPTQQDDELINEDSTDDDGFV